MCRRLLVISVVAFVSSCGGDDPVGPAPEATTIVVSESAVLLESLGASAQLTASVLDQDGADMAGAGLTWTSSDLTVATVLDGLVTAVANGEATISVSSGSATTDVTVTVEQAPASVALVPPAVQLAGQGDTLTVEATALDVGGSAIAGATVTWSSADVSLASVSDQGLVTALYPGSTEVSATVQSAVGSASVTIAPILPSDASFATVGNTELVAGGYTRPATPHVYAPDNLLTGSPGTSVTSVGTIATTQGGSVDIEADGDFRYRPPVGFGGGPDSFEFVVEGDESATVDFDVSGEVVWYVDNRGDAGADGRAHDPFATLAEAEAAGAAGHTIFVYAGDGSSTGLDQGVTLLDGQSLLGEGVGLVLGTFGTLVAPGDRPVITGGAVAVTMAGGNRVAGLEIVDAGGPAVSANAVDGGQLDELRIVASNDAALVFTDVTGTWGSSDLDIESSAPAGGLIVTGGDPQLTLDIAPNTFTNLPGGGPAIDISATTGGLVTIEGGPILEQGAGVVVDGTAGDVTVSSLLEVRDPSSDGIAIGQNTGTVTLSDIDVSTTGQRGIYTRRHDGPIELNGRLSTVGNLGLEQQAGALTPTGPLNATFSSFVVVNNGGGSRGRGLFMTSQTGWIEVDYLDITVGPHPRVTGGAIDFLAASGGGFRVTDPTSRIVHTDGDAFSALGGTSFGRTGDNFTVEMTLAWVEATRAGGGGSYGGAGIALLGVDGAVTVLDGAINDAGVRLSDGGTVDFEYGGTIDNATGLRPVQVLDQAGEILFTGPITSTSGGIVLRDNPGATVRFDGLLDLQADADSAFSATGGGTVEVTSPGNVISTTTGPAVQILDTDIGPAGVTFESVSADGAANGIELLNTGSLGGLTVTGTGAAGSGGSIQNSTGFGVLADGSNDLTLSGIDFMGVAGAIEVTNSSGLTLSNIDITGSTGDGVSLTLVENATVTDLLVDDPGGRGIDAAGLTGFDFDAVSVLGADSRGLAVNGFSGAGSITGSVFDGNAGNNFVQSGVGSFDLTVADSRFENTVTAAGESGAAGLWIRAAGTAVGTADLDDVTASGNANSGLVLATEDDASLTVTLDAVTVGSNANNGISIESRDQSAADVTVAGSSAIDGNVAGVSALSYNTSETTLDVGGATLDQNGFGVSLSSLDASELSFDVHDNVLTGHTNTAVFTSLESTAGSGGLHRNNSVTGAGQFGIYDRIRNDGVGVVEVYGNTISGTALSAILAIVDPLAGTSATLDFTVHDNDVALPGTSGHAIEVYALGSATACVDARVNLGGTAGQPFGPLGLFQFDAAALAVERLLGGSGSTTEPDDVTAHLAAENPLMLGTTAATVATQVDGVADGTCTLPTF